LLQRRPLISRRIAVRALETLPLIRDAPSVHGRRHNEGGDSGAVSTRGYFAFLTKEQLLMSVIEREVAAERRLSEDLTNYVGEWVAVRDHEIVAHASSAEELFARVGIHFDAIFEVLEEQTSACFF
jgi:hypothetical protein